MTDEEWRPIPGFDGYEASSLGRIRSFRRRTTPRVLKPSPTGGYGYLAVCLRDSTSARGERTRSVHGLVAAAFYGPRPDGLEVRHLNGNGLDNRIANLEYATHVENIRDKARHGTDHNASKTHCPAGHAYDQANTRIRADGRRRVCRACHRQNGRDRYAARIQRAAGIRAA
jgi:hypothetical protein